MPILKSAKKALRQNKKRRLLNLRRLRAMRQAIKDVKKAVGSVPKEQLQKLLSVAYKAIDKAAKREVIKKNTAARKKSRLTKFINASTKTQPEPVHPVKNPVAKPQRLYNETSNGVKQSPPPTNQEPSSSQPDQS